MINDRRKIMDISYLSLLFRVESYKSDARST